MGVCFIGVVTQNSVLPVLGVVSYNFRLLWRGVANVNRFCPIFSRGHLSFYILLFLILGNAARCAPLKIPEIASEDDIRVFFFHDVLSTVRM